MAKQDDWVRLTVRIPLELHERMQGAVAAGPNSMNAEIVARLEASFKGQFVDEASMNQGVALSTFALLKTLSVYARTPGVDMQQVIKTFSDGMKTVFKENDDINKIAQIVEDGLPG